MKNKSGVSLITLIITIIVVIILAVIVLRSGASDTPEQAAFSKFTSQMGELQDAVTKAMLEAKADELIEGNQRTEAQLYNFVARGGYKGFENERNRGNYSMPDDTKWLLQADAEKVACTIINKEFAPNLIGMKLPEIKVETEKSVSQEMSYFVTKEGIVFCWPPYVYDGKSYVNANTTVKTDSKIIDGKGVAGEDEMKETEATKLGEKTIVFDNDEYVVIENCVNSPDNSVYRDDYWGEGNPALYVGSSSLNPELTLEMPSVWYFGSRSTGITGLDFIIYRNDTAQ